MKTGIGLLDLYDDDSLNNVLDKIPENVYVCVVSNRKTTIKNNKIQNHIFVDKVSIAHMRNLILHDFRINNLDYYFILHSDQIINDSSIFEKIHETAKTFGTWFLSGYVDDKTLDVEDDNGFILKISKKLNTKFLYTFKGIIKNVGFFDEQFINTHDLDVYDYITRLKNKKLYTPNGFYPSISLKMVENKKTMENSYIKDFPSEDLTVRYSYGYFMNKNKFIPNHNEITESNEETVLQNINFLQSNYGKK
jgi:choline kinase